MFLRGLGRHSLHWGFFPNLFQQAFPAAEIELLDLAGNGTGGGPRQLSENRRLCPGSAAKVAIRCRGKNPLQYSGDLDGRHGCCGVGGATSGRNCANGADQYEFTRGFSRFYQRLRWRNYLRILRTAMQKDGLLVRERAILEMTARGLPQLESLARKYAAMPPTASANFVRQIFASSLYSYPQAPNCPVLFMASEGDNLVDPVCTRRLAGRWRAKRTFTRCRSRSPATGA